MYYEKSRRQLVFDTKGCHQVGEADLKGYDIIKRVYATSGKSPALTTMQGGHREPKIATPIRVGTINKGGQGDRIYSTEGKSISLSANSGGTAGKGNMLIEKDMYWRALTPKECERLQTVPDGYTEYGTFLDDRDYTNRKTYKKVSNSQRYKMLGNGWTVNVIAHIMKGME